jgi:hypothetical protein
MRLDGIGLLLPSCLSAFVERQMFNSSFRDKVNSADVSDRAKTRVLDDTSAHDTAAIIDEIIGRTLIAVALLLVGAIILTSEAQLPDSVRFGLFEATYTSP